MSIQSQIVDVANSYGIPAELALAVANAESGFNPNAVGSSGEYGIFQIMPQTAKELGINQYDTNQNIVGGIKYLSQQYNRFGDWEKALQAYNAGASRVVSGRIPDSTKGYVNRIFGQMQANIGGSQYATFSTDVWGESIASGFPWWLLVLGIVVVVGVGGRGQRDRST